MKKRSFAKLIKEDKKLMKYIQRAYVLIPVECKRKIKEVREFKLKFNL